MLHEPRNLRGRDARCDAKAHVGTTEGKELEAVMLPAGVRPGN